MGAAPPYHMIIRSNPSSATELLTIVAAVNNEAILSTNLLRSPDVISGAARVIEEREHVSAGAAYAAGISRAGVSDIVAFVHQDVYLPAGWVARIRNVLVDQQEAWAVAGVWGVRTDGQFVGRVWCNGGGREHVGLAGTCEVASVDEIVLLVNMRYGLEFDQKLPGFHLYATDLIAQARQRGLKTMCIEAPVVHNSRCNPQPLDGLFRSAYYYMQRKWAEQLPLRTCVVDVTPSGWPMYRQIIRNEVQRLRGTVRPAPPATDAAAIARRLGYESLMA
jgi:hypothetical protein